MSSFAAGEIRFFLKSQKSLRLELEGPQYTKSGLRVPSTEGLWQEIVVPIRTFAGVDLARLFGLFLITSDDGPATFYVDNVRWFIEPQPSVPIVVRTNGFCPLALEKTLALELNQAFTFTAGTYSGYAFSNWTDGLGVVLTNNPKLNFIMQSNLVLMANYLDVWRPVAAISWPTAGLRVSNQMVVARGTAKDTNGCVAQVRYQINGNDWVIADGFTNWTAEMTLMPGTNVLRACAVDAAGNSSLTNDVRFVYVLSDLMTVRRDGNGTIQPNYHGQSLELGRGYTMTATPALGFVFSNWTDGAGTGVTNGPTVTFLMRSNLVLQANFKDVQRPTTKIAAPLASQRWSNEVFTARGTAGDNCQVAVVWYQVNDEPWAQAVGTTNWQAEVSLRAGTNVLRVSATDATGNHSTTNTVSWFFVVPSWLTLVTNGLGTISRVDFFTNWLEVGRSYTVVANPGPGTTFSNWTDGTGAVLTRNPTLRFLMASNLVLAARFVDIAAPTLTITAPAPGQRWSNSVFAVRGMARDNVGVAQVFYQLNGGEWLGATGTTNWQAEVALAPGTNTVRACAVDAAGNRSLTNTVSWFFVVPSALTLVTNGPGTITRYGFTTNWLEVGRGYTVSANPGTGQVFSNWTGGYLSINHVLTFIMQSNLVLQANFVTNPFIALKGEYHGLFYPTNEMAVTNSGYFLLNLTGNGTFSGQLLLSGATLNFNGGFNVPGEARVAVPRSGMSTLLVDIVLVSSEGGAVDGWITDGNWVAALSSERVVASGSFAGNYTVGIYGTDDGAASPAGFGAGTLVVGGNGSARAAGALADGSPFSQQTGISGKGEWPLYVSLYGGRGLLMGWMGLNTNGLALWLKPRQPGDRYYTNGFHEVRSVGVARHVAPNAGGSVFDWTNGTVRLGAGNLPQFLASQVVFSNNQVRVQGGSISNLIFAFSPSDGLFSGSFVHPVTHVVTAFKGALIQDPLGFVRVPSAGWFLGVSQSGFITVEPVKPSLFGVNFSPYVDGQDPNIGSQVPLDQLRQRMRIVQPYTQWVRTFGCTHGLENAGQVAHELQRKAALGAWLSRDLAANEIEIASLISAARQGDADLAIVGSEVLLRGDLNESQLLSYIGRVKQELPNLPVTTADVYGELLTHTNVMTAVDLVFVNYYPFWEGVKISNAVATLHGWHVRMTNAAGSKPVVVSETGWPSGGDPVGKAVPSPENASYYFLNFISWARSNQVSYFYFSAFDESWKAAAEGSRGAYWGVWDKNGILKPGMRRVFDGELLPDNWSGRDIPGGAGTPAVELTHLPSYGSSEDLEGQVLHVRPADYAVVVYIYVGGWWVKPTFSSPLTTIQPDGSFSCDVTTGGVDETATAFALFVVPNDYSPPLLGGSALLPAELDNVAVAKEVVSRNP